MHVKQIKISIRYFSRAWWKVQHRHLVFSLLTLSSIGLSVNTEKEMPFPFSFTCVQLKVAPPSHQSFYLSSLFPKCIQYDVTSQHFSLSIGFKNPGPILLNDKVNIKKNCFLCCTNALLNCLNNDFDQWLLHFSNHS